MRSTAYIYIFSFWKIFKLFSFLLVCIIQKQKSFDLGQPIIYFQPIAKYYLYIFIFFGFVFQTFKPI